MTFRRFIFVDIILVPVLSITGCSFIQNHEPSINRDIAIMIAASNVPSDVIEFADVMTLWNESKWTVNFMLTNNVTVTEDELGWPEDPANEYENYILPTGNYSLLTFDIDRKTGVILSRRASDNVLLGGPGTWNTEPPETVFLPFWSVIAAGIVGILIGGLFIWVVSYLKRT